MAMAREEAAKGRLFVFTGPAGGGRHTVAEMIRMTHDLQMVLPHTTRQRRHGEGDEEAASFMQPAAFLQAYERGEFLDRFAVDGQLYGIKRDDIDRKIMHDNACVIVSTEGAARIKSIYGERVVRIFIYANKMEHAVRLFELGRSEEEVNGLLAAYEGEMRYKDQCEHGFENVDLAHTVYDLARMLDRLLLRDLIDLD